jgi:hypothetical protein
MKPKLKALGTTRLNLKYNALPSSYGFNFNLRRFSQVVDARAEVLRRRHAGHKPGVEGRWNYDERWRRDGGWYRAGTDA